MLRNAGEHLADPVAESAIFLRNVQNFHMSIRA